MVAKALPVSSELLDESEEQRAVDTNPATGDIVIRFGQSEPIELPRAVAIRFAMLLLKEAGLKTLGDLVAVYKGEKPRAH